MKKVFLIITLSFFGATAVATLPTGGSVALAQKRDKDDKKKDPPGPPVVRDKEKPKPPPPPKRDKKPE